MYKLNSFWAQISNTLQMGKVAHLVSWVHVCGRQSRPVRRACTPLVHDGHAGFSLVLLLSFGGLLSATNVPATRKPAHANHRVSSPPQRLTQRGTLACFCGASRQGREDARALDADLHCHQEEDVRVKDHWQSHLQHPPLPPPDGLVNSVLLFFYS